MSGGNYLAGINAAEMLLRAQPERARRVVIDERSTNPRLAMLEELATKAGRPVEKRRSHQLDDLAGGERHQGVVIDLAGSWTLDEAALLTLAEARLAAGEPLTLLALDEVTDPRNLGAVLRSAAAADVDAVVVPRERSAELTAAARKVASGAAEIVPLARVPSLARTAERLALYGVRIVGADGQATTSLYACDLTPPTLIILGAEHTGLTQAVAAACTERVAIPISDAVESLNVSVAAALLVFEVRRQRTALA